MAQGENAVYPLPQLQLTDATEIDVENCGLVVFWERGIIQGSRNDIRAFKRNGKSK